MANCVTYDRKLCIRISTICFIAKEEDTRFSKPEYRIKVTHIGNVECILNFGEDVIKRDNEFDRLKQALYDE